MIYDDKTQAIVDRTTDGECIKLFVVRLWRTKGIILTSCRVCVNKNEDKHLVAEIEETGHDLVVGPQDVRSTLKEAQEEVWRKYEHEVEKLRISWELCFR